jgi:hypothetical protein
MTLTALLDIRTGLQFQNQLSDYIKIKRTRRKRRRKTFKEEIGREAQEDIMIITFYEEIDQKESQIVRKA